MKAIFLCERTEKILKVYDESARARLKDLVGMDERIYTKQEILENPDGFREVEWVFSTQELLVLVRFTYKLCRL